MASEQEKLQRMLVEAEHKSIPEMWHVRSEQPMPQRVAAVALGAVFQYKAPRTVARRFIGHSEFPGHVQIGSGREQQAYRRGNMVVKVLTSADRYPGMPLEDIAEKLQKGTDACREIIGTQWLSTDFDVVTLPRTETHAVICRQPYINACKSYLGVNDIIKDRHVGEQSRVALAESLYELHDATGLMADTIGPHNVLRQSGGGLVIVDTIPVYPEIQAQLSEDGRTIGEHLHEHAEILRAA